MAPQQRPRTISHIHPIYKIYFLYLEALMAFAGALMVLINPEHFLQSTLPAGYLTIHPLTITPVLKMLLTNIAFLYGLISVLEGVVLRFSRERIVWVGVLAGLLVSDVGHLWSVFAVDRKRFWSVTEWNGDEWISYGTLLLGAGLRTLFLAGFGWR